MSKDLIQALERVLNSGRGTSGRIIIEREAEEEAREALSRHRSSVESVELPEPDLRGIDGATLHEWRMLRVPSDAVLIMEKDLPKIIERACLAYAAAIRSRGEKP